MFVSILFFIWKIKVYTWKEFYDNINYNIADRITLLLKNYIIYMLQLTIDNVQLTIIDEILTGFL